MKIYRVHYFNGYDGSHGYGYFWNKKDARKSASDWDKEKEGNAARDQIDAIRFDKTKEGIITLLAHTAMHNDNG